MIKDYRIYFENLSFFSFSRLMEAVRQTNDSVMKIIKSNAMTMPMPKRRPAIVAVDNGKGAKGSKSK